jgi:hypothetical protein
MAGNFARVIGVLGSFINAFGIAGTSGVARNSGCDCADWPGELMQDAAMSSSRVGRRVGI